jgi:hypothetical protein
MLMEEVIPVHVTETRKPGGAVVVNTSRTELVEVIGIAFIILVADGVELVVNSVNVVGFSVIADIPAI